MEVHGTNFHFIATKWKFTVRTFISSPRNGSSRRELPFHRHETEVHGTNFHFIATKWKFMARTSISSPRNGSSRHELPFHRHEMEVHGANFHFIATKWKFTPRTFVRLTPEGRDTLSQSEGRRLATKGTKSTKRKNHGP